MKAIQALLCTSSPITCSFSLLLHSQTTMEQQNEKSNYIDCYEKYASPYHIHLFNLTAKDALWQFIPQNKHQLRCASTCAIFLNL